MTPENFVKVCLVDLELTEPMMETVWCEPLGESKGEALYRIDNIPFFMLSLSIDDVIVAAPADWSSGRLAFVRLARDGGRYTLVFWYVSTEAPLWSVFIQEIEKYNLRTEGFHKLQGEKPGVLYVAAPLEVPPIKVLRVLWRIAPGWGWCLRYPRRTSTNLLFRFHRGSGRLTRRPSTWHLSRGSKLQ